MRIEEKLCIHGSNKKTVRFSIIHASALIAVCIIFALIAAACAGGSGEVVGSPKPDSTAASSPPVQSAPPVNDTPAPQETDAAGEAEVFYGYPPIYEFDKPKPAEYQYYNISEQVSDEANREKLFAVRIEYTPFGSLKKLLYSSDPVASRFLDEYERWKADNGLNEYEKRFPNDRNMTYDDDDLFMERFRELWKEQNSASDWERLCSAEERIQTIRRDLDERSVYEEQCRELEINRLDELGYHLTQREDYPLPYYLLTREQLESFPKAAEDDSYRFYWAVLPTEEMMGTGVGR